MKTTGLPTSRTTKGSLGGARLPTTRCRPCSMKSRQRSGQRPKAVLTALRDAALLKTVYAFGLFSGVRLLREGLASRVCAAQRLLDERLSAAAVVVQGPARRVIRAGSCG